MWRDFDLASHAQPTDLDGYRVVEDQQYISTRPLVDTDAEHDLLEQMIEESKPPNPADCPVDDYLLFTPFRYPPLRDGTRFGKITERSPFYGAESLIAALAEKAYRIEMFDRDTTATFPYRNLSYTSFKFAAKASTCLNVLIPPFDAFKAEIRDPQSHDVGQELGTEIRKSGIQACIFESARCPNENNMAIFDPSIFTRGHHERADVRWLITAARSRFIDDARRQQLGVRKLALLRRPADDPGEATSSEVVDHLAGLRPLHRPVLVLRYVDDLPVPEVAAAIGRDLTATNSLLARARADLRRTHRSPSHD